MAALVFPREALAPYLNSSADSNQRAARFIVATFGVALGKSVEWVGNHAHNLENFVTYPGVHLSARAVAHPAGDGPGSLEIKVQFDPSVSTANREDISEDVLTLVGIMSQGTDFRTSASATVAAEFGEGFRTIYLPGGSKVADANLTDWFGINDLGTEYSSDDVSFTFGDIVELRMTTAFIFGGGAKRPRGVGFSDLSLEGIIKTRRCLTDPGTTIGFKDCAARALVYLYNVNYEGVRMSDEHKTPLGESVFRRFTSHPVATIEAHYLCGVSGVDPSSNCLVGSLHKFCSPDGLGAMARIRVWEFNSTSFKVVSVTPDKRDDPANVQGTNATIIRRGGNSNVRFPAPVETRQTEWYNLLLHESHYYAIKKPNVLVSRQKWCDKCNEGFGKGYTKVERHKCVGKCPRCDSYDCTRVLSGAREIICEDCHLPFLNPGCLAIHKIAPETGPDKGISRCARFFKCNHDLCQGAIIAKTQIGTVQAFDENGVPYERQREHKHGEVVYCKACMCLSDPDNHQCIQSKRVQLTFCKPCKGFKKLGHLCNSKRRGMIGALKKLCGGEKNSEGFDDYCEVCEVGIDTSTHRCYMRRTIGKWAENYQVLGINPVREESYYQIFDFETRPISAENTSHMVNCWVVKSLDGSVTAHGWDIKSFMDYLIGDFGKPYSGRTFIAHNAQGFDTQFIMKVLVEYAQESLCSELALANILGDQANSNADLFVSSLLKYIKRGSKIPFLEICIEEFETFIALNPKMDKFEVLKELKEANLTWHSVTAIRIIDSANFLTMPLRRMPKTFGYKQEKGDFPYRFATEANESYSGPIPDVEWYDIIKKSKKDMEETVRWWVGEVYKTNNVGPMEQISRCMVKNCLPIELALIAPAIPAYVGPWKFKDEMLKYCIQDVEVLRLGVKAFRDTMLNIDPAPEVDIVSAFGNGEDEKDDEEEEEKKEIAVSEQFSPLKRRKKTKKARKKKTLAVVEGIDPYSCVTIASMCMKLFLAKFYKDKTLGNYFTNLTNWCRKGFHGGRTEVRKLWFKCKPHQTLKYVDFTSLYPTINKYGRYVIGFPFIIESLADFKALQESKDYKLPKHMRNRIGAGYQINSLDDVNTLLMEVNDQCYAMVQMDFCAPRGCMIPSISAKVNGKLVFDCMPHSDEVVSLDELTYAVNVKNYSVTNVSKIAFWPKNQVKVGMFQDYVNLFLKIKQESSGWPEWCTDDEKKAEYIAKFKAENQVDLEIANIMVNKGKRATAKLCLNSLWGKFVQRHNLKQNRMFTAAQVDEYHELVADDTIIANQQIMPNGHAIEVSYVKKEDFMELTKNTNIMVGVCTTSGARQMLVKSLDTLDRRQVCYMDTDSIIYVSDPQNPEFKELELGDNLGELTDEIAGDYPAGAVIKEVVCAGPKNYAYRVEWADPDDASKIKSSTTVKIKGFSLGGGHLDNDATSKKLTMDHMRMIVQKCGLEGKTLDGVETRDRRFLRRTGFEVQVHEAVKRTYKYVFDKSLVDPTTSDPEWHIDTVPFGYYQEDFDLGNALYSRGTTSHV